MKRNHLFLLLAAYFATLLVYTLFSYSLTDPNLVLTNIPAYWNFQQWMWQVFYADKRLLITAYSLLIFIMFGIYWKLIQVLRNKELKLSVSDTILSYLVLISPLFLAYNALSHDVFNYIFNARMVVEYGADPHTTAALTFNGDPWLRFMHNTHTAAPYGRGWTILSLAAYSLGFGKFLLTWLSFRLLAIISVIVAYLSLRYFSRQVLKKELKVAAAALVFLNPLFLIEVVANQHNDLWMIAAAAAGLALFISTIMEKSISKPLLLAGVVLWLLSIYFKLATLVLAPIFILFVALRISKNNIEAKYFSSKLKMLQPLFQRALAWITKIVNSYVPDMAAALLFIPLLTSRAQQFHPWYLLWIIVWLPFMRIKLFRELIIIFSLTSMLRYLPWMYNDGYSAEILFQQKLITWILPALYALIKINAKLFRNSGSTNLKSSGVTSYLQRLR